MRRALRISKSSSAAHLQNSRLEQPPFELESARLKQKEGPRSKTSVHAYKMGGCTPDEVGALGIMLVFGGDLESLLAIQERIY
jgi:hypothetical protein